MLQFLHVNINIASEQSALKSRKQAERPLSQLLPVLFPFSAKYKALLNKANHSNYNLERQKYKTSRVGRKEIHNVAVKNSGSTFSWGREEFLKKEARLKKMLYILFFKPNNSIILEQCKKSSKMFILVHGIFWLSDHSVPCIILINSAFVWTLFEHMNAN